MAGILAACFLAVLFHPSMSAAAGTADPPALYLTWRRDPATTMTIHWHTTDAVPSVLEFRQSGETSWKKASGTHCPMPESPKLRLIHTVELTGLKPDTHYRFRFAPEGPVFKFRTMRDDFSTKPLRFIEGGDVYHEKKWMDQMNALAAKLDPDFVVIGGDLAYSNNRTNKIEAVDRWADYFASWKKHAVAPDGRIIPLLVTIGNHEVKGFQSKSFADAAVFFSAFSMPGTNGYACLDFGRHLSLLLLDSGHIFDVAGAQTDWLKTALEARRDMPHVLPVYHVTAYPSCRSDADPDGGGITADIRKHWLPLFEAAGIRVAFEHHDHAYKRTHPIRAGKVDPEGIVFLGDGAWGVRIRNTRPVSQTWYLARAGSIRHFFLVQLYPEARHILAVNDKGEIFDELYQRAVPAR